MVSTYHLVSSQFPIEPDLYELYDSPEDNMFIAVKKAFLSNEFL